MYKMKIFVSILIVITITIIVINFKTTFEAFDNFYENQVIVIARYNEDLNWIKDKPFSSHPIIVYNKGGNKDFKKTDKIIEIKDLENVGREIHTYLYHIINNYDNLAEVTIFLPGSTNLEHKLIKATKMVGVVEKTNETSMKCDVAHNFVKKEYKFTIDSYLSTNIQNKELNSSSEMEPSFIQPYGKWFESLFGNTPNPCITWNAIISLSRNQILQHPKSYYENIISSLETHNNPEVGHYLERSLYALFYPFNENASRI